MTRAKDVQSSTAGHAASHLHSRWHISASKQPLQRSPWATPKLVSQAIAADLKHGSQQEWKKYKSRKWGHSNNKSGASISFRPKEERLVGAWWRDAQRLYAQFHSITLSCLFHGRLRLKPISTLSFRHSCCLDQGHGHYQENGLQVDIIEPQISFFEKGCYMLKFSIQKKVNPGHECMQEHSSMYSEGDHARCAMSCII